MVFARERELTTATHNHNPVYPRNTYFFLTPSQLVSVSNYNILYVELRLALNTNTNTRYQYKYRSWLAIITYNITHYTHPRSLFLSPRILYSHHFNRDTRDIFTFLVLGSSLTSTRINTQSLTEYSVFVRHEEISLDVIITIGRSLPYFCILY